MDATLLRPSSDANSLAMSNYGAVTRCQPSVPVGPAFRGGPKARQISKSSMSTASSEVEQLEDHEDWRITAFAPGPAIFRGEVSPMEGFGFFFTSILITSLEDRRLFYRGRYVPQMGPNRRSYCNKYCNTDDHDYHWFWLFNLEMETNNVMDWNPLDAVSWVVGGGMSQYMEYRRMPFSCSFSGHTSPKICTLL